MSTLPKLLKPHTLQQQFLEVFSNVRKLKTRQVTLHIYLELKPVAQLLRCVSFNLQDNLEASVQGLMAYDVIEEVSGPAPWVNSVAIVPKANGEIRLCIDMLRTNEAVVRG